MVSSLFSSFWLAAFASLVVALPMPDPNAGRSRHHCGVHISEARIRSAERRFQAHRLAPESENATATLGIYIHVVYSNETVEGGYIPDQQILSQVESLNRDYKATGLSWNLKNTTRIKSEDWFKNVAPDSEKETAMKVFRQGGKSDLNVYTVGFLNSDASGLLGIATFPMDYSSAPQSDGIMLLHSTLPGSDSPPYNLGRTLTHEAGHWLGLYHTFQGGCKSPGDEVEDTPPQAKASSGCPKKVKSCGQTEFDDLSNNFMDYSDDACMDSFTPLQIRRMRAQIATYRDVEFN